MVVIRLARKGRAKQNSAYGSLRSFRTSYFVLLTSYFVLCYAFWKLYGIGLPDQVLNKLYYGNALRLTPGLSHKGFTS